MASLDDQRDDLIARIKAAFPFEGPEQLRAKWKPVQDAEPFRAKLIKKVFGDKVWEEVEREPSLVYYFTEGEYLDAMLESNYEAFLYYLPAFLVRTLREPEQWIQKHEVMNAIVVLKESFTSEQIRVLVDFLYFHRQVQASNNHPLSDALEEGLRKLMLFLYDNSLEPELMASLITRRNELISRIKTVFPKNPPNKPFSITYNDFVDDYINDYLLGMFADKLWEDVISVRGLVYTLTDVDYLRAMTTYAFVYFLPALMVALLIEPHSWVFYSFFLETLSDHKDRLTLDQLEMIVAFLEYMVSWDIAWNSPDFYTPFRDELEHTQLTLMLYIDDKKRESAG
jgi:hypothetical protein